MGNLKMILSTIGKIKELVFFRRERKRDMQKAPDGNQALNKIIQGNYNMKNKKEQWKPQIINIMADGSVVEDLTGYVIPAGHSYYDIILGMHNRELQKGA